MARASGLSTSAGSTSTRPSTHLATCCRCVPRKTAPTCTCWRKSRRVSPTDKLRSINSRRQKVYTSIEIDPEFADTGEAYLVGLGVTDSPASLGTDYLSFCAGAGDANPMLARKSTPTSLFAEAIEHDAAAFAAALAPEDSLLARVRELLTRKPDAKPEAHAADVRAAVERLAAELTDARSTATELLDANHAEVVVMSRQLLATEALAAITARVESLEAGFAKIDATPAAAPPPPALGGGGGIALAAY